jgi:cell division protein FtsQ
VSAADAPRRRRRRTSPVRRLRPFWILLLLAAIVVLGGAYFLATWPALDPHRVIVTGEHVVPDDEILARANVDRGRNMWLQNTHAMAQRIEAIPYIDTAAVHRRLPDVLTIAVTERTPYAFVPGIGGAVTIDDRSRVLQEGAALGSLPQIDDTRLTLPAPGGFIHDARFAALVAVMKAAQSSGIAVDALKYDQFDDVDLRMRDGVMVLLGDGTDLQRRLEMIEPILTQVHGRRRIATIDLRAISTPVVVYGK